MASNKTSRGALVFFQLLPALQKEIQERRKCYGKAQEHYKIVQQEADIKILQRAKIIELLHEQTLLRVCVLIPKMS
jgi:hypothetical protein